MSTVLVIDDDATSRILTKAILQRAGYTVLLAGGGDEGLRIYRNHAVDVVVTDILMPGTDGLAVIRELLAMDPASRIIALSGGGMMLTAETSLQVARKMGAFFALVKPVSSAELLSVVESVLQRTSDEPPASTLEP
ncbi:MAG: response regulator [Magnetococcus sp. MYC-9]